MLNVALNFLNPQEECISASSPLAEAAPGRRMGACISVETLLQVARVCEARHLVGQVSSRPVRLPDCGRRRPEREVRYD